MNYEKIIKDNEKLIWKIAGHFYGVDKSDLFQAGVMGLLKALKNYKKDGLTKFSTYAHDYIFGEMYLLANSRSIKISKDILNLYKKIEQTRYMLAQKINKIPSNMELAEYLNLDLNTIELACMSGNKIMSLDSPNEEDNNIYDYLRSEDENIDTKILINDGLNSLDYREKEILKSRYFEDLTQNEVAKKLKLTQVMVSRYEKKGIYKMREYLNT